MSTLEMKTELYFASQNRDKLKEVRALTGMQIRSVAELGFEGELEETGLSLEANALQKAMFIRNRYGVNCFAEDTGLEIQALGGEPGVRSARYAGAGKAASDNIHLVLLKLRNAIDRRARFRTVVALALRQEEQLFEGILEGEITLAPSGQGGFGYDPVFRPVGFDLTLAEMTLEAKNRISHRGQAIRGMLAYLGNKGAQ
jgi:XTP/dITP diphosphohydrolase